MRPGSRLVSRSLSCLLGLTLLASCGGGGGGSRNFDSGMGFNASVLSIVPVLDGSGDIYVGGNFSQYNGTSVAKIVRLNADGSLD